MTEEGDSESLIGVTARNYVAGGQTSMYLNFRQQNYPDDFYKFIIRHEFGHALGLVHEHQHPDAPVTYNFTDAPHLEHDMKKFETEDGEYEYDFQSVMHYV